MNTHYFQKKNGQNLFRHAVVLIIVGALLLQPLIAADSWSKIKKLKSMTWVYVHLEGGYYTQGAFLRADASGMFFRALNQSEVAFVERDTVLQVAVNQKKRSWYSIPLTLAAAVAGGIGGYEIVERTTCMDTRKNCFKAKGVIVGGLAIGSGAVAYGLTHRESIGRKVIYRKSNK